jgi:hypothetical protein
LKGKSLQNILCKLCLAVAIYHLWRLVNDLCYGNTPLTEEALVARIKGNVRIRVLSSRKLKNLSGSLSHSSGVCKNVVLFLVLVFCGYWLCNNLFWLLVCCVESLFSCL